MKKPHFHLARHCASGVGLIQPDARFEESGARFLEHPGVLQEPVGWDALGETGQIRAGNASSTQGFAAYASGTLPDEMDAVSRPTPLFQNDADVGW